MNLITEHNYGERIPVSKNGKEDHLMEKENCFNLNIFIQLLIRYDISRKQIEEQEQNLRLGLFLILPDRITNLYYFFK